jgi:hypothetical protein
LNNSSTVSQKDISLADQKFAAGRRMGPDVATCQAPLISSIGAS